MTVDDVARLVKQLTPEQKARAVHVRHAKFDIYIGREMPGYAGSIWQNPYPLRNESQRRAVLRQFTTNFLKQEDLLTQLWRLEGKVLGCWCRRPGHDVLCHGLILVALADHFKAEREELWDEAEAVV